MRWREKEESPRNNSIGTCLWKTSYSWGEWLETQKPRLTQAQAERQPLMIFGQIPPYLFWFPFLMFLTYFFSLSSGGLGVNSTWGRVRGCPFVQQVLIEP